MVLFAHLLRDLAEGAAWGLALGCGFDLLRWRLGGQRPEWLGEHMVTPGVATQAVIPVTAARPARHAVTHRALARRRHR